MKQTFNNWIVGAGFKLGSIEIPSQLLPKSLKVPQSPPKSPKVRNGRSSFKNIWTGDQLLTGLELVISSNCINYVDRFHFEWMIGSWPMSGPMFRVFESLHSKMLIEK